MINILKRYDRLLLQYENEGSYYDDASWIEKKLKENGEVTLGRIFTFEVGAVLKDIDQHVFSEDRRTFLLGVEDGVFYRVNRKILGLKHDLRISKKMEINVKTFVAHRGISIFRKIDDLIDEPIVIGGDSDNAISVEDFKELLQNFPTSTELTYYAQARITRIL